MDEKIARLRQLRLEKEAADRAANPPRPRGNTAAKPPK